LHLSRPFANRLFSGIVTSIKSTFSQEALMFELFEKAALTGLGFLSLSQKKAEELLNELKEKYKVSEEEGKAFLDKMQGMAKESRERITEIAESEVKKAMDRLGLVTREEFDRLQKRVDALETRPRDVEPGESC
jgi:polyhydroxyalkanoate synthesis regulator phasin